MKNRSGAFFTLGLTSGLCALLAGCPAAPPAAVNDDGLQRVDTTMFDELYVAPGVSLAYYKRVMLDPIEIEFKKDWRKRDHPDLSDSDFETFRAELAKKLRETLVTELAHGGYTIAESPDKDVLRLRATIEEADFAGPEQFYDKKTFAYVDGKMTLRIQGFDGPSGTLVARAKDYEEDSKSYILERADRISAFRNAQRMFDKWAEALRSALDVARVQAGARTPQQ